MAFEEFKSQLLRPPIATFPVFSLPFRLYIDASAMGLGFILAQVQGGQELIVCCATQTTTATEHHYGATKLKCLTIICTLRAFRHYLIGAPYEVITTTTSCNGSKP